MTPFLFFASVVDGAELLQGQTIGEMTLLRKRIEPGII